MFSLLATLTTFSALTILIAGGLSLLRNASRAEHKWFFGLTFMMAVWVPMNFFGSNIVEPRTTEILVRFDFCFALLMGWFMLQFVAALISGNPEFENNKHFFVQSIPFRIITASLNVLLIGLIFGGLIFHVSIKDEGLAVATTNIFWVYVIVIVTYLYYSLSILARGYLKISRSYRQGLDIILAGFSAAIIANIATNLIFPFLIHTRSTVKALNIIGYVGILVLVISIYVAIATKKLFDIRFYVVRAGAYSFTILFLAVLYVAPVVYVLSVVIMSVPLTLPKFILTVLVTTIAALNYESIRSMFNRATSKIFFRDSYDSAMLLGELNQIVVTNTDPSKLLHTSADLIAKNLKSDYCVFVLKGKNDEEPRVIGTKSMKLSTSSANHIWRLISKTSGGAVITDYLTSESHEIKALLTHNDIAVAIPLSSATVSGEDTIGYILLGFKKSGNVYNSQDIHTLNTMSNTLTVSLQSALYYEEIQKFNVTLQQKVDDATRKLRRTNEKLKELDESKDDFISMASHQLRTPLTAVKGYVSMVLEGDAGKVTPKQRKMLDQAFLSSQRMVFLIADLLNVSRLKTGKFVIEPTRVRLDQLVQDEVNQLMETAKARKIELSYEKPINFPEVILDDTKTRQVVMNYIDNAIYYTKAGGHITVVLENKPASIEMRVIDDGIGVPKDEQPHLFTKFYRAGNARRARPDGTGLGLFMAKKVVAAQGGAVLFDSKEGKGSTFGFVFSKAKILASSEAASPTSTAAK